MVHFSAAVVALWTVLTCWVGSSYGQAQFIRDAVTTADFPRPTSGEPLTVSMSFTLVDIVKVDPESNEVELVLWTMYNWKLEGIKWRPETFGNVTSIRMPVEEIWTPDVVSYTSTRASEPLSPGNVVISNDGSILYVPAERIHIMCDVTGYDSHSEVICASKFGSWTYDGNKLDLKVNSEMVDLSSYFEGSKFEVLKATQQREVTYYSCCPEPYVDVKLKFAFRKKKEGGFFSGLFD